MEQGKPAGPHPLGERYSQGVNMVGLSGDMVGPNGSVGSSGHNAFWLGRVEHSVGPYCGLFWGQNVPDGESESGVMPRMI